MLMQIRQKKSVITLALAMGLFSSSLLLASCSQEKSVTESSTIQHSAVSININSAFITEQPLHNHASYGLAITDSKNNILAAQVITCNDVNDCTIELDEWHPPQTGLGYVRLFNNRGGLVAANIIDLSASSLRSGAATTLNVKFSEITTGDYILGRLSELGSVLLTGDNGDVATDLNNFIGLPANYVPEIAVPSAGYFAAKALGLEYNENDAILRLWYSLYGREQDYPGSVDNDDDGNGGRCHASSAVPLRPLPAQSHCPARFITIQQLQPTLTFNYRAPAKQLMERIIIANQGDDVASGFAGLSGSMLRKGEQDGDANAKKDDKPQEIKLNDPAKAVVKQLVGNVISGLSGEQKPISKEQEATVKMAKAVCNLTLSAVNYAVPGLGAVLAFISDSAFDAFYPEGAKADPNAALVSGLTAINDTLLKQTQVLTDEFKTSNNNNLNSSRKEIDELIVKIETATNLVYKYINTGKVVAQRANVKIDMAAPSFIYASLLDDYIKYNDDSVKAINDVLNLFNNHDKAVNLVKDIDILTKYSTINDFMTKLAVVRKDQIKEMLQKVSDGTNNNGMDYVQIDKAYFRDMLKVEFDILTALNRARTYQLAAAYLKFKSQYKRQFNTVFMSEASLNSASYEDEVDSINSLYQQRMEQVSKTFKETMITTTGIKDASRFYEPGVVIAKNPGEVAPCEISYWDGTNLGTICPGQAVGGGILVNRVNKVAQTCGLNKINLNRNRLYCNTQKMAGASYMDKQLWTEKKDIDPLIYYYFDNDNFSIHRQSSRFIPTSDYEPLFNNAARSGGKFNWSSGGNSEDYETQLSYNIGNGFLHFNLFTSNEERKFLFFTKRNSDIRMTLGCVTSDCLVIGNSDPVEVTTKVKTLKCFERGCTNRAEDVINPIVTTSLYFATGDMIDLVGLYRSNDKQIFEIKHRGNITKRPLPYGNWQEYCDPEYLTFVNGVISTKCSTAKWRTRRADDVAAETTIDVDNKCKLGSSLKINKVTAELECVNAK